MRATILFILKRIKLSLIFLFKGIDGLSKELGRDAKKNIGNPVQIELAIRSMSSYIYITALSEALGVPPDVIISALARQAEILEQMLNQDNVKGREQMYM